jgi:hypothetical protein
MRRIVEGEVAHAPPRALAHRELQQLDGVCVPRALPAPLKGKTTEMLRIGERICRQIARGNPRNACRQFPICFYELAHRLPRDLKWDEQADGHGVAMSSCYPAMQLRQIMLRIVDLIGSPPPFTVLQQYSM